MLTTDQKFVINNIQNHWNNNLIRIIGSAGTGKTFLVSKLIEHHKRELFKDFKKIAVCGLTNKATKVLQKTFDNHYNIVFSTLHGLLKLKQEIDPRTGSLSFKRNRNQKNALDEYSLIIVDEVSMMNKELFKILTSDLKNKNVKCILIGDDKQLPPVNESISPVFEHNNCTTYRLNEIVRQKGENPIIHLSYHLDTIDSFIPNRINNVGYIYTNSVQDIVTTLAEVNGTDDLKFLAWTNERVNNINSLVRTYLYDSPNKVMLNESLIVEKPYDTYNVNDEVRIEDIKIITKSFFYSVKSKVSDNISTSGLTASLYDIKSKIEKVDFKVYVCNENLFIIHEDDEEKYNNFLNYLVELINKNQFDWFSFYKFKDQFFDFKYNHAITIHKSQGSTYKQCIIDYDNMCLNKNKDEFNKLLYTGITRASDLLIIYSNRYD